LQHPVFRPKSTPLANAGIAMPLDAFALLERVEWDTLLFFCGALLAVGGLG
jgi:Na+/H+ antiporter NhaD/arsenite permease-like protein